MEYAWSRAGSGWMFSYVTLEQRVPQAHPWSEIRKLADTVLGSLSAKFDALYAACVRCCCRRSIRCGGQGPRAFP